MKDFLSKNAKLIYLLCGVLSFLTLVLSLAFMTQYRYLRLNYVLTVNAATGEEKTVIGPQGTLNGADQQALFDFFNQLGAGFYDDFDNYKDHPELKEIKENPAIMDQTEGKLTEEIKTQIFNYRKRLDSYNSMIVIFSAVSLVAFALIFVFSNHSRKIYYKSNLVAGIVLPGIIIVFNLVLIIMSIGLASELQANYNVYNLVSVLQNPQNKIYTQMALSDATNNANLGKILAGFDCNTLTFVLFDLLFGFVIIYNAFLIAYAVLKYKWTGERRAEVIERSKIVGELI